jgi:hypothetical protein
VVRVSISVPSEVAKHVSSAKLKELAVLYGKTKERLLYAESTIRNLLKFYDEFCYASFKERCKDLAIAIAESVAINIEVKPLSEVLEALKSNVSTKIDADILVGVVRKLIEFFTDSKW